MTEQPTNKARTPDDRLAVVSLVASLCVPAVVYAVSFTRAVSDAGNVVQDALLWVAIAGAIAAATGGLISIGRIQRSSGSMQGVPLAIGAMVVSIVQVSFGGFLLFVRVVVGFENFH